LPQTASPLSTEKQPPTLRAKPGAPQPWETHGHRRRYRKRGHHHHHGVQLLRSVSTPTPNRNRQHQPRQFNDLWVKLDTQDKSSSDMNSDSMLRNSRKKTAFMESFKK
ncbi:hypothetical protein CEXT_708501, partial [Caerostris extrusa]